MTNIPERPQVGDGGLYAKFEIREAKAGERGLMHSTGIGGACLLGQSAQPQACRKQSDCQYPGFAGYCLADGRVALREVKSPGVMTDDVAIDVVAPRGPVGTCWWYREVDDPKVCMRGLEQGKYQIGPVDISLISSQTQFTKWRLQTCLNGTPGGCGGQMWNDRPGVAQTQAGAIYLPQ